MVRFEVARLLKEKSRLASKVERVSETQGDGLGFDVLSFEVTGEERLIEVKTTAFGAMTPFYVTRNEVEVSCSKPEKYHLYRAFDFRRRPRLFSVKGSLGGNFNLDPTVYRARLA